MSAPPPAHDLAHERGYAAAREELADAMNAWHQAAAALDRHGAPPLSEGPDPLLVADRATWAWVHLLALQRGAPVPGHDPATA
ncbi:hypothetical protein Val02_77910 [Virgisporangium aliadipatigenens]|uniref:Uncharacterized protein n=1 Tax=Virgisporangium aliadipatigenens TaxID=741659 RepID=A0A8J4DU39_9ACTN|nr:hypothetical protein [Virgisporangium aliadipatigenens]GIJ50905.1 hypothetical protein Val02_77910 [Virgisporangium aliadipatigenens]